MRIIFFNLFIFSCLSSSLTGQTGNEFSGTGAGNGVSTGDYNTAFGYQALYYDNASYASTFGAFGGYASHNNVTTLGYKAGYFYSYYSIHLGVSAGYGYNYSYGDSYCSLIGHNIGVGSKSIHGSIMIGENIGNHTTSGNYSVFVGQNAAYSYDVEDEAVIIGHNAGYYSQQGGNIAIGNYATGYGNGAAGYLHSTGSWNVSLGASAGSSIATGNYSTFIGTGAGAYAKGKNDNTFVGGLAGYNTATENTAGSAYRNTLIGYKAGYSNIGGANNTVVGYNADFADSSFNQVIMVGANTVASEDYLTLAGYGATGTAEGGVGIGNEITMGGERAVGVGYQTNIGESGDYSISLGYQSSMSGDSSIGIGYLTDVQGSAAVAIGTEAAVAGDHSTALGSTHVISSSNAMALGYNMSISTDNQINIGNDDVMSISGITNWVTTSDGRLKTKIQADIPGLDFILKLRPVTYQLAVDSGRQTMPPSANNRIRYTGFIAQEVAQTAQSLSYDFSGIDKPQHENDRYGLRYSQFTVPLVKAVQEISDQQQQTQQVIENSSEKINSMDALLENLEKRMAQVSGN
ncbi:MAG: tail fiber domain-containing protein [Lewinellaceae bacterium]|nr:tail fiber domain-containing protein [Lewinellaceae bacterium]